VLADSIPGSHAISISWSRHSVLRCDERCTSPIYNYARFLPWLQAVEEISGVFRVASGLRERRSANPSVEEKPAEVFAYPPGENSMGTPSQVEAYCFPMGEPKSILRSRLGYDVWCRVVLASLLALLLQWGTTGAAVIINWFTPTTGLGCRSGSYLVYGVVATISWMMLVLSSFLAHYSTASPRQGDSSRMIKRTSILLRRLGKSLATINAIWIVVLCLFQFTKFYDRCYCNSSIFYWGTTKGFNVIHLVPNDIISMTRAWTGGVVLATSSAILFVGFVNLSINPRLPD